jgi:uncharacterized coiled-coil protein SlyX
MAREQVQNLPTRGIRPANVQAGQYRVAVQQAPESQLMGLARGLSSVNRGLQSYVEAGAKISDMFEQEIEGMTFEQLKQKKEEIEGKLDGQVRKGVLPFLGNPINWERNKRALGKQIASRFYDQVVSEDGRFYNGRKAGDENLTINEILEQEESAFYDQHPEFASSPILQQGFQSEWMQRRNAINLRFTDQRSKEFLANTTISTANSILTLMDSYQDQLANPESTEADQELALEALQSSVADQWQELNALKPTDQRKVVRAIIQTLAEDDPEAARSFLENATARLNVGGQPFANEKKLYLDMVDMISDIEEREAEASDVSAQRRKREEDANIARDVKIQTDQHIQNIRRIENGEVVTWGTTEDNQKNYTSVSDYLDDVDRHLLALNDRIGRPVMDEIATFSGESREDKMREYVFRRINLQNQQSLNIAEYTSQIRFKQEGAGKEYQIMGTREERELRDSVVRSLQQAADDAYLEAQAEDLPFAELQKRTDEIYRKKAREILDKASSDISELDKSIKEGAAAKSEIEAKEFQDAKEQNKPIPIIPLSGKPKIGKPLAVDLGANLDIMIEGDDANAKIASKYFWDGFDSQKFRDVINGATTIKKEEEILTDYFGGDFSIPQERYTQEDRDAYQEVYLRYRALTGAYANLHNFQPKADEEGVYITDDGYFLEAKKLSPSRHLILTEDEVNAADPASLASVKKKAKIIGVDTTNLVETQKKLYKRYSPVLQRIKEAKK